MGNFKALWSAQQGFNDAKAVVEKISVCDAYPRGIWCMSDHSFYQREVSMRRARILDPEKERMQRLKHNLGGNMLPVSCHPHSL
jgi:hypothetical protein